LPGKSAKRVFALDDPAIHLLASLLRSLLDTHAEPGLKSKYVKRFTFEYRRPGYYVEAGLRKAQLACPDSAM
jgi:hypothetical protein